MNNNDKNNAGYEFTALILSLLPTFIVIGLIVVMAIVTSGSVSYSFIIFSVSSVITCITIALMGLEVNSSVSRVDLLESWADYRVIEIYYKNIAKKKKFPVLFIIFIFNAAILLGGMMYDFFVTGFNKGGYIFLSLIAVLILLAFILRYLSKFVIDNNNSQ